MPSAPETDALSPELWEQKLDYTKHHSELAAQRQPLYPVCFDVYFVCFRYAVLLDE